MQKLVSNTVILLSLVFVFEIFSGGLAQAKSPEKDANSKNSVNFDEEFNRLKRNYRVAPVFSYLSHRSDIQGATGSVGGLRTGYGLMGEFNYWVTKGTTFGFLIGLTRFANKSIGANTMWLFNYGMVLRHKFDVFGIAGADSGPYMGYGILLQEASLSGIAGSAYSHDTKLSLGYGFQIAGQAAFLELAHHTARVGFFNSSMSSLSRFELAFGAEFNPK